MKKLVYVALAAILGFGIVNASETPMAAEASALSTSSSTGINIPTGVFFNGSNFVKVESTWVRICVGGQMAEYSINNVEMDPYNNYALVLSNGSSMTIYSGGRQLYYGGVTYSKK